LDPITDIFRTMHVAAFGLHRLEATAPWGVKQEEQTEDKVTPSDKKMPPTDLAHFVMLSRGNCWLSVEGIPEPIPLTGGDCLLLARGTSIVLRDSPLTRPRWSFREIGAKANNNVAHCGGGGAPTTIVCGSFSFDRARLKPITQLLPSFILMKADQARTLALHNTVQALASEMAEQTPGSEVLATRLPGRKQRTLPQVHTEPSKSELQLLRCIWPVMRYLARGIEELHAGRSVGGHAQQNACASFGVA
jgi:hypothetical protein